LNVKLNVCYHTKRQLTISEMSTWCNSCGTFCYCC